MATGPAESWYHEKECAWLYGIVAAAKPDPVKRALFVKLAAAEDQAARWLAGRPPGAQPGEQPADQPAKPVFTPRLRARMVARLARLTGPHRLRHVGKRHSPLRAAVFGAGILG